MGNDWSRYRLPLEVYTLVVGLLGLPVKREENKVVLSRYSTPVRWGRMVMWLHCYCWVLPPLDPKEFLWPSSVLSLRGMMLAEELGDLRPWFLGGVWLWVVNWYHHGGDTF
jgi:hypothetical protein